MEGWSPLLLAAELAGKQLGQALQTFVHHSGYPQPAIRGHSLFGQDVAN
jgi:hypothetical protein